ncbi:MFS lactose [Mycena sanguinolenta]|uniref:MFS lactose n=1 Tax=Mycena sanguinolenta TaxID=230812 RepID=A0A8H6Y7B0_9AGAR|nr:MFS lactose [Mycena sanguinolenta]
MLAVLTHLSVMKLLAFEEAAALRHSLAQCLSTLAPEIPLFFSLLPCPRKLFPQKPEAEDEPTPSRRTHNVLNADLALALSTGPQLKPFSANIFKLYLILSVAAMGSLSFGFDTNVISGVNGMVQFTNYFSIGGGDSGGGQGVITAMLYSVFTFGCIAGSFVAGSIADRWGRRGGMFIASVIMLTGVSVVTAAQNRTYLLVGRFAIGFGSTLNNSSAPAYVSELAPPQWRGCIAGLYNCFSFVGSMICSGLTVATGNINSSLSWRVPFAVQFMPSIILAIGVCFIPESPRWLMSVGRKDEARNILAKYHGNGDANAPLVVLEWRELEALIKTNDSGKGWWNYFNYSELFISRGARYRIFITSWLGFCCLMSGTGIFYYVTVAFDLAGVKTQHGRLVFSSVSAVMAALGALFGASIIDRIGRRTLWLLGTANCALTLGITAGFMAKKQSKGAIAFLLLFAFVQNMTYVPLQGKSYRVYIAECLNFSVRAKGLAVVALIQSLAALVNNYAGAVGFQAIGWEYIMVWAIWDVAETVIIWFCAVETKGRTLEELDEIFEDRHPVKASLNKHYDARGQS